MYAQKHAPFHDLFQSEFEFKKSSSERLVQLADFIAGSMARHFEPKLKETNSRDYLGIIKPKSSRLAVWPEDGRGYDIDLGEVSSECDAKIARAALNTAHVFIDLNSGNTEYPIFEQTLLLQKLVEEFRFGSNRWIYSGELVDSIESVTLRQLNTKAFRLRVVAPLRDEGILVASSKTGYKIASSHEDCASFCAKTLSTISPMLTRIHKFADRVKIATSGEIDLLEPEEMYQIKAAVNAELPSLAPTEEPTPTAKPRTTRLETPRHQALSPPLM